MKEDWWKNDPVVEQPAASSSDNWWQNDPVFAPAPTPPAPESSYGDVLSKAATNAKLGLLQAAGGGMQAVGEAPISAVQTLSQPEPTLPQNPSISDYISKYATYPIKQGLAKGELAATALPAAIAPDFMTNLAQSGKQIQQEATAQQQENQPNVAPGSFKSKVGQAAQMGLELAPTLLASAVAPESIPALFGGQGFGSTYAEQTNAGKTGGEALLPSVASGAANTAMGEIPLGILTSEGGSLGSKLLKAGIAGEVTSQGLNAVQQGINKGTIDPNMTWDQFKQSAKDIGGIGAALGLAGGAIAHPLTREKSSSAATPEILNDNGTVVSDKAFNPSTGRMEDIGTTAPTATAESFPEQHEVDKQGRLFTDNNGNAIPPEMRESPSQPQLSPATDVDTAKTTLDAIKTGDLDNVHPDVLNDLAKSGEIQINDGEKPALTDLGNKLLDELNNLPPSDKNVTPQSPAQELPTPANANGENRLLSFTNETAPEAAQKISDADQARLVELEKEHDALPVDSPLKPQIVQEMNDIVEKSPVVQQTRAEGLIKNPTEDINGKITTEEATPEEQKALQDYQVEKSDIPFSVTPKSNSGSLVVQHNLTADNLEHAHKMGGIAVPSLAITKGDHPLHSFGEISLIGNKELINPKGSAKNKVYGSDVYSSRYPDVQYHVKNKDVSALNDKLRPFIDKTGSREFDTQSIEANGAPKFERHAAVMASFLESKGIKPDYVTEKEYGKISQHKSESNLNTQIDKNHLRNELTAYSHDMLRSLNPDEKIFNGYTPSGNRKYLPHDLDTVVKLLTKKVRGGENFNYGVGSIRAEYSKQFKSLADIKAHEDRIVDSKTFDKIKEDVDNEFFKLADKWRDFSHNKNAFGFLDNFSEHLKEAARDGLPTINKEYYDGKVPLEILKETAGFLNKLKDFNTEYFEAKLQRPVGIGEFQGAVVPEGSKWDKSVETLKKNGVNRIERYTHGDEESRKQAIGKFSDTFFKATESNPVPTERFAAQQDNIKAKLDNIIKRINPDVKTEFTDKMFGEGEAVKASGGDSTARQEVAGSYNKAENLIKASLNTEKWDTTDTAYHEAYHSVRDMVKPADDAVLKQAFPGTDKLAQPEHEAVEFGRFMTQKNATGFAPAVRRIFSAIRQALRDIGRTFKLGKFNSVEDIFNRAERGSVYKDYQDAIRNGDIEALKNISSGDQYKGAGNKFTDAFKKWFGDSKVVDKNGEPLVVYHATNGDFESFTTGRKTINSHTFGNQETERHGIFATPDHEFAQDYFREGDGKNVVPVHMSIKSPIDFSDGIPDHIVDEFDTKGINLKWIKPTQTWELFDGDEGKKFVEAAKELGYDGAIINEEKGYDGNALSYVAFDPSQIKSIHNRGTYDPNDPRILYKATEGGLPPEQQEKAIKEVSPALHDIVYKATPSDDDLNALKNINAEAHGTPEEKATAIGNDVYGRLGDAVNKGLDSAESAKEKMLRSGLELAKPFIGEKTYKQAQRRTEAAIAKTKRSSGGLDIKNTTRDVAHIIMSSNDGHLRAIGARRNSPTVEKLADTLHPDPGRGKGLGRGYHEEIAHFTNKTLSQVARVLHDTVEQKDKDAVRNYMTNPASMTEAAVKNDPNARAAAHLSGMIQDMRDHLLAAGYEVPQTEGFYPRIYDTNAIVNNEAGFKADARKAYYDTYKEAFNEYKTDAEVRSALDDMVNRWYNNILLQDDGITSDPNGYFKNVSTIPDAPSSFKQRVLSKNADDILSNWMVKDPLSAMNKLAVQTGRKAGWEKFFGGDKLNQLHQGLINDGLDGKEISQVMNILRSNTGQLGSSIDGRIKNALALSRYWTAVRFLTKAPFKHLSISLNAGAHTGNPINAWRTLVDSTHALFNTDKIQATKIYAELAGITGESAEHAMLLNQSGMMSDNEKINFMSNAYYDAVGMTKLIGAHKVGMQRSIQYMLGDMADDIVNRKNGWRSQEFMMKNYPVPPEEVQNFAKWIMDNGGKDIDNSIKLGDSKYADMYRAASQRATDQIISNPTAATRQMYASHPLASLIYQLSAYHMTAMKNSLQRNARLFAEGLKTGKDYDMRDRLRFMAPLTMYLPAMTLFMYGYNKAKDTLASPDQKDKTNPVAKAIVDADLFGQFNFLAKDVIGSQYAQKKLGYYYHDWDARKSTAEKAYDMLGPDFSMFKDYAKMIGNVSNNMSANNKAKDAELKSEYSNIVAPILTSFIANYVPFPLLSFAAIQAVNHPEIRRAVVKAVK